MVVLRRRDRAVEGNAKHVYERSRLASFMGGIIFGIAIVGCVTSMEITSFLGSITSMVQWTGTMDKVNKIVADIPAASDPPPRLGDGCYHVYLDVGANIGVHTRFLFEPERYPFARHARQIFDSEFGSMRDNRDICSFGFEPNPAHIQHHHNLEQAYQVMGWKYTFVHAGVSDQNGNLTFYRVDSKADDSRNEWGFSMVRTRKDGLDVPVQVPIIDFSAWIEEHIAHRQLPTLVYGNYSKPKVVMKMDIEGSEYIVLPRLLFDGHLCKVIDFSFGEMHPWSATRIQRNATGPRGRGELKFNTEAETNHWHHWLISRAFNSQSLEACKGSWLDLDDESYVVDKTPLPEPPSQNSTVPSI